MVALTMTKGAHRFISLLLLLAVLAGLYWLVNGVLIAKYRFYQTNVEQLQDRLQRFNALLATREDLEAQIQAIKQNQSDKAYYLSQTSPTLAASQLQQRVKQVVESNGGSLVSTQILPEANEGGFSQVAIRVQMSGDTNALQQVLYALESARPLLFIDNVRVRSRVIRQRQRNRTRDRRNPAVVTEKVQLTLQFELGGYMRRGEG